MKRNRRPKSATRRTAAAKASVATKTRPEKSAPTNGRAPARAKVAGLPPKATGHARAKAAALTARRQPRAEPVPAIAAARRAPIAVVGIGASAGGFEAFRRFVATVPPESGLAIVLIQHLDPTHRSLTAELMSRYTEMSIAQAEDEMRVEADHIYVIPPNRYLTIRGERLHLTEPVERRGLRVPIDFFFRSLAEAQQERAIGILFSGTGTDGTLGVREIKAGGGMVLVQDPETAAYDGMIRSAMATGVVDRVVRVEQMSDILTRYVRHWYVNGAGAPPVRLDKAPSDVDAILELLRARARYDFRGYKRGTLSRRIQRRMGVNHIETMADYVTFLRHNREEAGLLYKDLLISVTNFFREPEAWHELEERVMIPLVRAHAEDRPIRAWVAGCATGEEAYTLAMLLIEQCAAADKGCGVQVFASDIDADALARARAGIYPENIAADIAPDRLRQHFTRAGHSYHISKQLRESVVFAEQNVISDPPFSKLDLICCRNLLIYLEPEVQKRVFALFHFALMEGGYLFLGSSETISHPQQLFRPESRSHRIFRRISKPGAERIELPQVSGQRRLSPAGRLLGAGVERRTAVRAIDLILRHFAPACVLIDRKLRVLYLHGPLDRYLQVPAGEPTSDLVTLARGGLRNKLRAAVDEAIANRRRVTVSDVRLKGEPELAKLRIAVEPLEAGRDGEGLFLVSFEDASEGERPRPAAHEPAAVDLEPGESEFAIRRLEDDLRSTRQDLETTIQELETSNEEFKAANEEVTSVNEELQSTNEELETSKEELQSLNEELQTVNSQLEMKVSELESLNNDLANLFASADIATIFLDRQGRIRRFTPAARRLLPLIETDLGRPLGDLTLSLRDDELLRDADRVLQDLTPIEREVDDPGGQSYLRRILPFRTEDDRIEGVVITFADVTRLRQQESVVRALNQQLQKHVEQRGKELRQLIENAPDGIAIVNDQAAIIDVNPRTEELFGWPRAELLGEAIEVLVPERFRTAHASHRAAYYAVRTPRPMGAGLDLFGLRRDGTEFAVDIQLIPMEMDGHPVTVAAIRDVTQVKLAEAMKAMLAAVVESSSAAILVTDLDGTFRVWNQGAERLFGWTAAEMIGRKLEALIPSDVPESFELFKQRLLRNEPVVDHETVRLHKDGSRIDVAVAEFLIRDETGAPIEVCAIDTDIRPRKQMEKRMADLLDQERERVGRELHDTLGQQVTAIGMLVGSLRTQFPADSEQAVAVSRLEETVDQAKVQLRALIRGVFPVAVEPEELGWGLRDLAHETARLYGRKCRFEAEGEPAAVADRFIATQLYMIAREAIHNAVHHAQAGEIVIRLVDGDNVCLSVEDDGIGIPAEVDESATMGLRIMRYRASRVGGRLVIERRPGGGTLLSVIRGPARTSGVGGRP